MEITFSGKRALVTGGAQGIGLAIVKRLLSCGAHVIILDRQADKLRKVAKELPGVETVVVDLSNWKDTEQAMKTVGRVQLVVNNAGVSIHEDAQSVTEGNLNKCLDINLKSVMNICKHVVNDLSSVQSRGSIVNIASCASLRSGPTCTSPAYYASKAALAHYTKCLALQVAPKGIRVNAVSPGWVPTPLTEKTLAQPRIIEAMSRTVPMKDPLVAPEDVANAVAFLLSEEYAGKITGVNLPVDSGQLLT